MSIMTFVECDCCHRGIYDGDDFFRATSTVCSLAGDSIENSNYSAEYEVCVECWHELEVKWNEMMPKWAANTARTK